MSNLERFLIRLYHFLLAFYPRGFQSAFGEEMQNDFLICNAYVTSKYKKGEEYFVDLTWWDTTFDNYIVQEGNATVKLPKK